MFVCLCEKCFDKMTNNSDLKLLLEKLIFKNLMLRIALLTAFTGEIVTFVDESVMKACYVRLAVFFYGAFHSDDKRT